MYGMLLPSFEVQNMQRLDTNNNIWCVKDVLTDAENLSDIS